MTSCGCFECIACVLPGHRRHHDRRPRVLGPDAGRDDLLVLAEMTGGGQQTPGFIGIGTLYVLSRKFISADGGLRAAGLDDDAHQAEARRAAARRCEEIGQPELYDKIADETVCTDLEPLIEHLAAVDHPALALGEMI